MKIDTMLPHAAAVQVPFREVVVPSTLASKPGRRLALASSEARGSLARVRLGILKDCVLFASEIGPYRLRGSWILYKCFPVRI